MPSRATASLHPFTFRGLRVVFDPMPGPMTAIALCIRAGARFDGRIPGLAHMAEHMLFQGTGRRTSERIAADASLALSYTLSPSHTGQASRLVMDATRSSTVRGPLSLVAP